VNELTFSNKTATQKKFDSTIKISQCFQNFFQKSQTTYDKYIISTS